METVVGEEGCIDGKFEDCEIENLLYNVSPPKQIEDPVVYKLVRVKGDGRLVPATDDEIMEVTDLLKDESVDMDTVTNPEKRMCIAMEESINPTLLSESSGFEQYENDKADTGKIDAMAQGIALPLAGHLDAGDTNRENDTEEWSNRQDHPIMGSELSSDATCAGSNPDISEPKEDICLGNPSIRELHETFRVTFGRETTVKDKGWLKRRIIMGLTNSCDVSTTSLSIKDNQVMITEKGGKSKNVCDLANFSDQVRAMDEYNKLSDNENKDHKHSHLVSLKRLRSHDLVDTVKSDSSNQEETTAKRVRKPTKRYIEELSEVEFRDNVSRLTSSNRGPGVASPKSDGTTAKSIYSETKTFVTRLDSFAGIQVPCVSRLRRSRPRKDIMSLTRFNHSSMGAAAKIVKRALYNYPSANEAGNNYTRLQPIQKQIVEESEEYRHTTTNNTEQEQNISRRDSGLSEDASNENVATVPTAKGGLRRKHHRAWTLSEVMKLVDGVSKYGAGRWSEIKRLSFASYSYRTSVDLKDKWRNLLKAANFASAPTDLMNSRKHAVTPIPASILSRVRELAESNSQASPSTTTTNKLGPGGRNANGSASGYL